MIKFRVPLASFFLLFFVVGSALAQDMPSRAEEIAEKYYYKKSLVSLLYDRDQDYRSAFDCTRVLDERQNNSGGLDAMCVVADDILFISTRMGTKRRLDSAYVCPVNQDKRIVSEVIEMSYESKPMKRGTMYGIGYTDGWLRDMANRFAVMDVDGEQLSCWDIGRR